MGGGFGGKTGCKNEPLAVLLAFKTGRPVRLAFTSEEQLLTNTQHAAKITLRTGVMNDGTLVARQSKIQLNSGAYSDASPLVAEKAGYRIPGSYRWKHIDTEVVIHAIASNKDVDGFHPENLGRLAAGKPKFIPCTPKGIMRILEHFHIDPSGKHAVVLGRSNIVGRPMSILLSHKQSYSNATTTICHSGTSDLRTFTKQADILVAALGAPEMIDDSYVKEGAIIIDVGINRVKDDSEKGYKLVGDVNFNAVQGVAGSITPVPGGVGPMTIAMLVENTVEATESLFA